MRSDVIGGAEFGRVVRRLCCSLSAVLVVGACTVSPGVDGDRALSPSAFIADERFRCVVDVPGLGQQPVQAVTRVAATLRRASRVEAESITPGVGGPFPPLVAMLGTGTVTTQWTAAGRPGCPGWGLVAWLEGSLSDNPVLRVSVMIRDPVVVGRDGGVGIVPYWSALSLPMSDRGDARGRFVLVDGWGGGWVLSVVAESAPSWRGMRRGRDAGEFAARRSARLGEGGGASADLSWHGARDGGAQ